jgi:hypothetical protein
MLMPNSLHLPKQTTVRNLKLPYKRHESGLRLTSFLERPC